MTTPINARDLLLQQTVPRVINVASNYITLVSPNLEARYSADNNPVPAIIEITTILSGNLSGQVVFEITGLQPNTQLVLDSQNSNKLLLDPNTFATDSVVVTAKLTFQGIEYVSVPVTAYRNYTSIVTRLSRAFDNVATDVNGNNYNLPSTNTLELYNGTTKITTGVVYGPATTTKGGLTCTVNSSTGVITFSQAAANGWITDQETFVFTATRNFIPYTVSYSINKIREGGTGIDATPPPTPANFTATAAINTIIIAHDTPTYTQGSGHDKTILYGKVYNSGDILTPFNPAEVLAEFTGNVYTFPSEPATTWRLWAKWRSKDGYVSTIPAGGTNGIMVTTGQDVSKLLEALSGEITESQLYATLTSRIDLIDTPNSGLVDKTNALVNIYGTTASAAQSALEAGQAKADAIIAKTLAEGASAEAIVARGIAENSAIVATEESILATAAKDAAQLSETNASQYANTALSSATNAQGSASIATAQAGLATDAKDAAQLSETNASQYANTALTSVTNAAGSASTATAQADLATAAKNAAQLSETNASQYADTALTSATNAAGSASTATAQAGLATDAKDAAQLSETNASQYANTALSSSISAAGSASIAAAESGLATAAKDAAQLSETNASQYANTALSSSISAAGSASIAAAESGLATAAKDAAQLSETNASQYANTALSSSISAAGSASIAAAESGLATAAKDAAQLSETNASQYANTALSSSISAAGSASIAIAESGLATAAKDAAATSETNASISQNNSAISEINAAGSATSAATSLLQVQATIRGTSLGLPLEQWVLNGQSIVTLPTSGTNAGKVGTKALRLSGVAGAYPNQGNYIPLDRSKKYRIKFWARPSSTLQGAGIVNAAGTLYFSLRQFVDDAGAVTGLTNGGRSPYKPNAITRAQHVTAYGDTWGEYNFVWSSSDWQANTMFVQPEFLDNYTGAAGYWDIQGFTFTDVTQTEELTATVQTLATTTAGPDGVTAQYTVKTNAAGHVAGFGLSSANNSSGAATSVFGITADRFFIAPPATVSATAPTTNLYDGYTWIDTSVPATPVTKYRSGTTWVTTPPIFPFVVQAAPLVGTGTAQAPQFPAGVYIDAAFIKNATITTAKIADLAVDNAKIADAAITNAKINDLNASKITAGTISADRIAASSITAAKLSVTDLAAINANMGTVTAGKMQSTDNKFIIDLTNKYISITV